MSDHQGSTRPSNSEESQDRTKDEQYPAKIILTIGMRASCCTIGNEVLPDLPDCAVALRL
jgi:hypothetical protein